MELKFRFKKMQIFICIFFITFFCKAQSGFDTIIDYNNYLVFPYSINQSADSGYVYITSSDTYPSADSLEFFKLNKDGSFGHIKQFGFSGYRLYVGLSHSMKHTF